MFFYVFLTILSLLSSVFSLKCYLCASGDKYSEIQSAILEATAQEIPQCHEKARRECKDDKGSDEIKCLTMASDEGNDNDELKWCYNPSYLGMIDSLPNPKKCKEINAQDKRHCRICDSDFCNSSKTPSGTTSMIAVTFIARLLFRFLFL